MDVAVNAEIAAIRRELTHIKAELTADSLDSSLSSLPLVDAADVATETASHAAQSTELERLRRERDELRVWLQRGVAECRRLADSAAHTRRELSERQTQSAALDAACAALRERVALLEAELSESHDTAAAARRQLTQMESEMETLFQLGELDALRQRAALLPGALHALRTMADRLTQLIAHTERLSEAIRRGALTDIAGEDFFAAPDPNTSSDTLKEREEGAEALLARAKGLMHRVAASLSALRGDVVLLVTSERRATAEQFDAQRERLDALHLQKQDALHQYDADRAHLTECVRRLQRDAAAALNGAMAKETTEAMCVEQVERITQLTTNNAQLVTRNEELRAEQERLRAKLRRMRVDWAKVHQSQERFQQLQLEVEMIAQVNERLRRENENLKLLMEVSQMGGTTQNGTNNLNDATRVVKTHKSPSAKRIAASRESAEREVFQEWKRTALSEYME